jgi:predicted phosphoribosyltransferase
MLIVGGNDPQVLALNRTAMDHMRCERRLAVVPGATHLFSEPGTLEHAARLASSWFAQHLRPSTPVARSERRTPYRDRTEAGEELAREVDVRALGIEDPIVIGLPRGGVEVAVPVARAIGAPLEVVVVRKVGAPWQPEYALGAVDEDGAATFDDHARATFGLSPRNVDRLVRRAAQEAGERAQALRGGRPVADVQGRDVVLVDDGYATGMTAIAAARYLKRHGARRVVLAVPVGPRELVQHPPAEFDAVVCRYQPDPFRAVGLHYQKFDQVPDAAVRTMLEDGTVGGSADRTPGVRS